MINMEFEEWEQRVCYLANRNLTAGEWMRYLPFLPFHETCPTGS